MECNIFVHLEICSNNAVRLVNKAKTQLFRSILNFKCFLNHVDFVSQPASPPAGRKTRLR